MAQDPLKIHIPWRDCIHPPRISVSSSDLVPLFSLSSFCKSTKLLFKTSLRILWLRSPSTICTWFCPFTEGRYCLRVKDKCRMSFSPQMGILNHKLREDVSWAVSSYTDKGVRLINRAVLEWLVYEYWRVSMTSWRCSGTLVVTLNFGTNATDLEMSGSSSSSSSSSESGIGRFSAFTRLLLSNCATIQHKSFNYRPHW